MLAQKYGIKNPLLQDVGNVELKVYNECTEQHCAQEFGQCVGICRAGNCPKRFNHTHAFKYEGQSETGKYFRCVICGITHNTGEN